VHRALFDRHNAPLSALKEAAEHISLTERNSADAERDSKDVKRFAFLKGQLKSGRLEQYPALVTDVRNFGFFVDVPGLAMSGVVPLSTVEDDFFVFDAARNLLVGRRTRRVIRLGDRVTVQVAKVDTLKKQVDFRLADSARAPLRQAPRPGGSKPAHTTCSTPKRQQPRPGGGRWKTGRARTTPSRRPLTR
jgi:ribonuclease R